MKKYIIFILLLITLLSSCGINTFYRRLVAPSQVKEMVRQIVDKKITLKSLEIKRLEYEDIKNQINKRDHSNANSHSMCQEIINYFNYVNVEDIIYRDLHNTKDNNLIYDYRVWVVYTNTTLMLTFRKFGEDNYYFKDAELILCSGY